MHFVFFFFVILITFSACEKEIEIDLSSKAGQLVVEGYIQQGYPAYVFLTKSESFFNQVDSNSINNISVSDALVFVQRQDGLTHQLTYVDQNILDSLDFSDSIQLPFNALYVDLFYQQDNFSESDYRYNLIVYWNGDTITSSTYLPKQYPIDSVWVKRKDPLVQDHKCYIWARVNDPDTMGNSALIHFKRDVGWKPMSPLFVPCALSARTDAIVNGENFEAIFARSGRFDDDDGSLLPFDADRYENGQFRRRDIVILRISHIDRKTYNFWRSVERNQNSAGNPFSEPMNLSSNIQGGLGIWGGYGVTYYYVPIVHDTIIYTAYDSVPAFEIF